MGRARSPFQGLFLAWPRTASPPTPCSQCSSHKVLIHPPGRDRRKSRSGQVHKESCPTLHTSCQAGEPEPAQQPQPGGSSQEGAGQPAPPLASASEPASLGLQDWLPCRQGASGPSATGLPPPEARYRSGPPSGPAGRLVPRAGGPPPPPGCRTRTLGRPSPAPALAVIRPEGRHLGSLAEHAAGPAGSRGEALAA